MRPIPPIPASIKPKPRIVDKCHDSYALGFKLGFNLAGITLNSGTSYRSLTKISRCVDEYIAYLNLYYQRGKSGANTKTVNSYCMYQGNNEAN